MSSAGNSGISPPHVKEKGETNLSIQNDAPLLVNPKILPHRLAILLREKAICEANEAVGRGHLCAKNAGRTLELPRYLNTMDHWTM